MPTTHHDAVNQLLPADGGQAVSLTRRQRDRQRRRHLVTAGRFVAMLIAVTAVAVGAEPAKRPVTQVEPVRDVLHGVEIVDPYRWLEDQQSRETRAWIEEQTAYTDAVIGGLPGHEQIARRLSELMRVDVVELPTVRGNRYFFSKRAAEQDLAVISMREGVDGPDRTLIDPKQFSPDGSKSVEELDVSDDGTLLAYGIRDGGEDEFVVRFLDVDRGEHLDDMLPKAHYFGISLTPDKRTVYYTRHDDDGSRVFRHRMGQDVAGDEVIFGGNYDPGIIVVPSLSEEGRFLLIHVYYGSAALKTDIYYRDLSGDGPIRPVVDDVEARFEGEAVGDRLFMLTNWEAPNGRILAADLTSPERANWKEVVAHGDAVIRGFSLVGDKLFVNFLDDVTSRVKIYGPQGQFEREISFPSLGTVGSVTGRWRQDDAFFSFNSFHIPPTIYRFDVRENQRQIWYRTDVPVDSGRFAVKQVWYTSRDGTRVPMFIAHRKNIRLDGSNPTILYGYGGFNISLTPRFSQRAIVWMEHGGVYAMPNLRGGGEFGEEWHKAGMLDKKQNVFDDFLAAADWLFEQGYTQPSKLAIAGGSNGGLLVGAAMTQHPEKFRAVVCGYPLLDMIRYHKFLVARFWIPEYGSSDDADQFAYLREYSPYHQVKQGTEYPAVLLITGDSDTRVDPLHARKMAALLQASTGSERPVLLRYDTKLGHSRGRPVSRQIEDLTYELVFLLDQLGVSVPADG